MSLRSVVVFALTPFAVGIAVLGLYLLFSYSTLGRDNPRAVAQVVKAFKKGQLVEDPYQHPSTTIGSHQWNDCLITMLAVDERGDRLRLALSPIIADFPQQPEASLNPCKGLKALVSGAALDPALYHYDRYVHGAAALLRFLLPHFEIKRIRALYRAGLTTVLVVGFGLSLIGIARGIRVREFAVMATTFLVLLRFFGLEFFSQSLGHGPADSVVALYALAVAAMLFAPSGPLLAVGLASLFGALTVILELFTGGMPLGFAMVIGLSTLAVRAEARPQGVLLAAWAAAAFVIAAAVVYLLKLLAIASLEGYAVIADVIQRMRYYSMAAETGLDVRAFVGQLAASLGGLVGGMDLLAWAAVVGALLAGCYGALSIYRHVADAATRRQALLLVLSVPPVPLWFLVFANETGPHAWYADRLFAWPVAAGFGLFLVSVIARRQAPADGLSQSRSA